MNKILCASLLLSLLVSCGGKHSIESAADYYKGRRNLDQNLFRVSAPDYYCASPLIAANGGIVSQASDQSSIRCEISVRRPPDLIDDFLEFRSDIIILTFDDYLRFYDSIARINPEVFAITGFSAGNIAMLAKEGTPLDFPPATTQYTYPKKTPPHDFLLMLGRITGISLKNAAPEDSSAAAMAAAIKASALPVIDIYHQSAEGYQSIISTKEFDRSEPYLMITRKFFLIERSEQVKTLLTKLFDGSWIIRKGDTPLNFPVFDKNLQDLFCAASASDNAAFFSETPSKDITYPELIFARLTSYNKKAVSIAASFNPQFIYAAKYKEKYYNAKLTSRSPIATKVIETAAPLFSEEEKKIIRLFAIQAKTVSDRIITITPFNFSNYSAGISGGNYIRTELLQSGIPSSQIRIANTGKNDSLKPNSIQLVISR